MTMLEKIIEELKKRTENGTKDCTIHMNKSGDAITISPCNYTGEVEYFLIYCSIPCSGRETWEETAKFIMEYDKHLQEQAEEEKKIREYFEEHSKNNTIDWSWYSDWHKDVFGYRPHGNVCGVYINPHLKYC